jgi:hypothetical protein
MRYRFALMMNERGGAMRRLASYIRKYGDVAGRIIYRTLQSQASQARWKAFYRDRRQ